MSTQSRTIHVAATLAACLVLTLTSSTALARQGANVPQSPIIVSGTVPDQAARAAILARAREVFGAARVVDQLVIGPVAASRNWNEQMARLITPSLRQVSHGQLKFDGASATLRGDVPSEAARQQIGAELAAAVPATQAGGEGAIAVSSSLRVAVSEQSVLDAALANRIIEFDSGKATLTDSGKAILDQMSAALLTIKQRKVEVIGHTDDAGARASNLALSQARAEAVRDYVVARGVRPDLVAVSGEGPDRPVADNRGAEGRARNRRIEFRVLQ